MIYRTLRKLSILDLYISRYWVVWGYHIPEKLFASSDVHWQDKNPYYALRLLSFFYRLNRDGSNCIRMSRSR